MVLFLYVYRKKYQSEKVSIWYFVPKEEVPYSTLYFFPLVLFFYTPWQSSLLCIVEELAGPYGQHKETLLSAPREVSTGK